MILVPPLTFLALLVLLRIRFPTYGWRGNGIRAAVYLGAYAVFATELLSLLSALARSAILIAWLLPLLVCGALLGRELRRSGRLAHPTIPSGLGVTEKLLIGGLLLIAITTAVVAWFAPPQTWDSLNYHMPRVAHWANQASVRHYPTGIEVQNSRTPGAEFLVLQTYLLAGGDRWVNFVQWSAMALSVLGVSRLAVQLGATRKGQLAASLFAATLPMGIIQASSTNTDYLVALWTLAAMLEVFELRDRGPRGEILLPLALAAGLGLTTKPTAMIYFAPTALYSAYLLVRDGRLGTAARWAFVALIVVGSLNLGPIMRNIETYGGPFNPRQVEIHSNQVRSLRGVTSNLIRHVGLHLGTPSPHVNKAITLGAQWLHGAIGLSMEDPRTTAHGVFRVSPPTTNEDLAGNPLHAYLLITLVAYAVFRRPSPASGGGFLIVMLALSLLGMAILFKWQIFATRYHLPFFVLCGALAGTILGRIGRGRWLAPAAVVLLIGSIPWLLWIKSRPLITGLGETYVGSVLSEPRSDLYLANGKNLLDPYLEFTRRIREAGCLQTGIALGGNAAEYPLWAFLGAPRSGIQIDWIVAGTPSERYRDQDYRPCAIICENCPPDWLEFRGLARNETRAEFQLYMNGEQDSG